LSTPNTREGSPRSGRGTLITVLVVLSLLELGAIVAAVVARLR
jgi:hypothetical protein